MQPGQAQSQAMQQPFPSMFPSGEVNPMFWQGSCIPQPSASPCCQPIGYAAASPGSSTMQSSHLPVMLGPASDLGQDLSFVAAEPRPHFVHNIGFPMPSPGFQSRASPASQAQYHPSGRAGNSPMPGVAGPAGLQLG
eukprot:scaffold390311_cov50-Prasinocladus_malaysianus.AAC.1